MMTLGRLFHNGTRWEQEFHFAPAVLNYTTEKRVFAFAENFMTVYILAVTYQ